MKPSDLDPEGRPGEGHMASDKLNVKCKSDYSVKKYEPLRGHCTNERRVRKRNKKLRRELI